VTLPENIVPFLVPGRFIKIRQGSISAINEGTSPTMDWGWGVVVNYQKQRINPKKFVMGNSKNKDYIDVL
jgi:rRNA-processing arch domain